MNILYTITWPEPNPEEILRQFYEQLRSSVAHGERFPYDCPYEIALVHASSTPDATPPPTAWAVAILGNSIASDTLGDIERTVPKLKSWLRQCTQDGYPAGIVIHTANATHLKLASELRPDYDIIANFGTFVGEPEIEPPEKPAESKPALPAEAKKTVAEVRSPGSNEVGKTQGSQSLAHAAGTISPPMKPITPKPAIPNTVSTCLGVGMMLIGIILIPISLVLGALLAIGEFYTDPATASTAASTAPPSVGEFVLYLACCPLPILILGIGLIFLGIFVPRWLKGNQSLSVTPPKG